MALYFVGILAPEEINTKVLKWKQYMLEHFGCKVALRSPAHVTLIPPFRVAGEAEDNLMTALQIFARPEKVFNLSLEKFSSFPPRVIFVSVQQSRELELLQKTLEMYMITNAFPVKSSTRPFHPHITIANRDLKRSDYPKAFDYFRDKKYSVTFTANAIHLLRSEPEGWQVIGEFAFHG